MEDNKYIIAVEALKERKEELLQEVKSLEASIRAMESKGYGYVTEPIAKKQEAKTDSGYNPESSFAKKFGYLLKKHKRFLHFREAAEMINELEGLKHDVSELTKKLSSGTQSLKGKNAIIKVKAGSNNQNTFWGVPHWLKEDGTIKEEHMYNEAYLHSSVEANDDLFSGF